MHTRLDCIPCFARQALEAARFAGDGEDSRRRILSEALLMLAEDIDTGHSPPRTGLRLHRLVRRLSGHEDPYGGVNVAHMEDDLHGDGVEDPGAAVALALEKGLRAPLHGEITLLREAVGRAEHILFLADNAGEIVVDRLLVERLPAGRVTVAVRGRPVLNDATLADAAAAGMDQVAAVVDNGSDAPGTLLEDCSSVFRKAFAEADVVLAKGQGNYESLSETAADVFFLFNVKCPLVAVHSGLPEGAHALLRSAARRAGSA